MAGEKRICTHCYKGLIDWKRNDWTKRGLHYTCYKQLEQERCILAMHENYEREMEEVRLQKKLIST